MRTEQSGIPRPAFWAAVVLGVLLLAAVVALGVYARSGGGSPGQQQNAEANKPLAVAPVPAPQAGSRWCAALMGNLPARMTSNGVRLHRMRLAKPAPPASAAWAASGEPVVLRCGLPKPGELKPTSHLTDVSGVSWLRVPGAGRSTYYAVDRPVYVALTLPASAGTGPLQEISARIGATLPRQPVRP